MKRAVIKGVGSYLPATIRTNADLEKMVDTNDAWIVERTGIRQRHIAAEGELTSDLAAAACKQALDRAGIPASAVDVLLVATVTPDETFPSTAVYVQKKIGMTSGAAMDLQAACSGFVYGLHLARALISTGQAKTILVVGAEIFSRIVDWSDRNTCILFGDGAGAVVLQAEEGKGDASDRGVLYTRIASDGETAGLLRTTGGVSLSQNAGTVYMNGREVFRHAVARMTEEVKTSLAETGIAQEQVRWLVPHQANARILGAVADKLGVGEDRVIQSVGNHANTSAASIPLAFAQAVDANQFKSGDLIATPALGAGLTWGTSLLRW